MQMPFFIQKNGKRLQSAAANKKQENKKQENKKQTDQKQTYQKQTNQKQVWFRDPCGI